MSDDNLEQFLSQNLGTSSTVLIRKRDKLRKFLRIPKSKSKDIMPRTSNQLTRPSSSVSQVFNGPPVYNQSVVFLPVIQEAKLQSSLQLPPPNKAQVAMDIFPDNLPRPVFKTELPRLQERIERTDQLVYCISLLLQDSLYPATVPRDDMASDAALCLQHFTLDKAELDWLKEIKKDPMEQDHLRWLLTRMVEAFTADTTTKDSVELAEIVAIGHVLQKKPYRKLLSSFINDFGDARNLDVNLLQGLVELVQSASPDHLVSDDMIRILGILRVRLQGTHQQSTEHTYLLTLAISGILNVMADHKMQDLDRVLQHEPLSGVLSGLNDSSDPYLMYQACYAFQALQYVLDDESALQAVLRHSIGVLDGLDKVSGVFKLDLASVLEGLTSLQESLGGIVGVATTACEGVSSLMVSGQSVFDSLKEGLGIGQKRPWYPTIRAANAFAQAGQLKDLRQLIFEAPCRQDPLFQWGICQLLGEIAINPVWDVATRQQAITLLGHLFKVDRDWGRDESVKAWMLTIITKLVSTSDHAVYTIALSLLQDVDHNQCTSILHPYPLMIRLPIPKSSPILAKVYNTFSVEYDLHKLRLQQLKEAHLPVYIPPMAKANLQAGDDDLFPLMDKVQEFLASDRQVMLILGDSGSGKSTFNKHLELILLQSYTSGSRIPLFINLPAIREPEEDMVVKQLRNYDFTEDQIQEMKQHRQFILICDGYDESQLDVNLHKTNRLNQQGQWYAKMIISCRSQFLGPGYLNRFVPQPMDHYKSARLHLFQEAVIAPFSKKQVEDYVTRYVPLEPRLWVTEDYMRMLMTIPNLMDLVKNPFLLTLSLEALPEVIKDQQDLSTMQVTRVKLYDCFVDQWLGVNIRRLHGSSLSKDDREMLGHLTDAGFVSQGINYSRDLAVAIFEQQDGNPVVRYIHLEEHTTWKEKYFGPKVKARLLRESSPLTRTGNFHQFVHRSLLEYFLSRAVFDPNRHVDNQEFPPQPDPNASIAQSSDFHGPLFTRSILTEPSVIQFLCERVKQHPDFEKQLLAVIEQSKNDLTAATAAANAITILVRAGVRFNGADLRGIRIPGADLSDSQLDSAQLQDADLTNVNFASSWMRRTDLSGAQMSGVRFGELPYLKQQQRVSICTYSPDGRMLAVGGDKGVLSIYDTTIWSKVYQHSVSSGSIECVAFSPSSQQLIYGTSRGHVRLWLIANKDSVLDMEGHAECVNSVVFSPCGRQCASASSDKTVRLWNTETGKCVFVLEGHTDVVAGVAYCAGGKRLVSGSCIAGPFSMGSGDETIRVWDSETGELVACWSVARDKFSKLAFSADGQWVAVAPRFYGNILITNIVTGEPGPVLDKSVTNNMAFSPNGQWIATSGSDRRDNTLRLWDISSGRLIFRFSGHVSVITTCSFSPSGFQIASGDLSGYVRLWEVDTSRAIMDLDRPIMPVLTVTYSPDGRSILSQSSGRGVQQWDSRTGVPGPPPLKMYDHVSSFSLSPDGSQIATGHLDCTIQLCSRHADTAECILPGYIGGVSQLAYSPCGRWIVATGQEQVRLWDLHTKEHLALISQGSGEFKYDHYCVALKSTGEIVLGVDDGTISLYCPRAKNPGTALKTISMHIWIISLDCSPDGQELAIGAYDGTIYLWDFQSDEPYIKLKEHGNKVLSVAYSPCGKWILSSSEDKTVRIWRFRTGEVSSWTCVTVIGACSKTILCLAWNPLVTTLEFVTGCEDGSIRAWRIASHDDADGGDMSVQMLWSNDIGLFCASDLTFKGAISLSLINQKLLVQRDAIDDSLVSEGERVGTEELKVE